MAATDLEVTVPTSPAEGDLLHLDGDCGGTGAMHRKMGAAEAMEAGLEPCGDCCPTRVLVGQSTVSNRRAHIERGCRYVDDSYGWWPVELALAWGFPVCDECLNGHHGSGWDDR